MTEAAKQIDGAILTELLALVKEYTGITMEERKRELLFSRLRRRMRALNIEVVSHYVMFLKKNPQEVQEFINLVTTNETFFFRTPLIWEYFRNEFLPQWSAKNPNESLKIWSAASSSGEEAHSLAIACEEFKLTHPGFRYRIYGSDISTAVLDEAKAGLFSGKSIEDFKVKQPALVEKYFKYVPEEKAYKASDLLRVNIEFSIHNLHRLPAKQNFYDIVFIRNVLIYFNDLDQQLVLKNMHSALKSQGILILGESESLARFASPFVYQKPLIYQRDS